MTEREKHLEQLHNIIMDEIHHLMEMDFPKNTVMSIYLKNLASLIERWEKKIHPIVESPHDSAR